jgi:arginine:agmatine antiporter
MSTDKKIGPLLAVMTVASVMIGSGVYLLPASLGAVGSISIIAWVIAAMGAALIGGVFAWLAVARPDTKGLFSYVGDALGPGAAFVAGALYWAGAVMGCVGVALAVAGYLSVFVPAAAKPPGITIATVAILWLLAGANIIGPRFVARLQSIALPLGLLPVLLVAVFGWFFFHEDTFARSWNVSGESDLAIVPHTAVLVFWAFIGLETASIIAVRVKNPARDVPIATLGGLAIAAIIYMAASVAIMGILPAAQLAKSSAPFADAVVPMLGALASGAVALCATIKAAGTLGGVFLVGVETAECESVLGRMKVRVAQPGQRVSTANLLFMGVLTSLIAIASASPTIARQFGLMAGAAVVFIMMAYALAALALVRISGSLPKAQQLWARALGLSAALFAAALIASSGRTLLTSAAAGIVIALIAYVLVRMRMSAATKALSNA